MTEEDQDLPSPVDALVVGTAFAEAAVAAALARAGDRVLHVDRNAYYGGSGAGFSLGKLQAWAAERTERAKSRADEEVGVQLTAADRAALAAEGFSDVAVVPLATRDAAVVHAAPPLPTAASLAAAAGAVDAGVDADTTTDAAAAAAAAVVRDVVAAAAAAGAVAPARAMVAGAARFNIDLDARALLAAGDAVDALVRAGVAPYLDFLPIPRLLYWDGGAAAPTTVPCSKRDVFAAPDVAAADKRRLLRVMQAAQDRGEGAAAATLNERALTASRALRRPQNRSRAARAGDDAAPFAASLAADDGLAPPLARAVAYAVALADSADVPRGAGLDALGAHCRALARAPEGATAFLAKKFNQASNCATQVGLSDLCTHGQDGAAATEPVFPFRIDMVPAAAHTPTAPSTLDMLMRYLSAIEPGTALYTVVAYDSPQDYTAGRGRRLGDMVTASNCTTSAFGDAKLFFRHQRIEEDWALRPEWMAHLDGKKHCGAASIDPIPPSKCSEEKGEMEGAS